MRRRPVAAIVLAAGLLVAACSGAGATSGGGAAGSGAAGVPRVELVVFGAGSLKGALEQAAKTYAAANPGVTVTVATDSSATLATQIEQGAPADVFLSADTRNPQRLVDGGLALGDPVVFARNELAVIVPSGNPAGLTSPADLARKGVNVIAAGEEVPITQYATQLLANLAALPGYPPGFVDSYAANVVSSEDNASAVAAKVELGEGDVAIVYATDAAASDKVDTLEVPADANVQARYAGVVLEASEHPDAAAEFLDWFAGAGGAVILEGFGFLPAP